jgi:dTDP-4-amino-4,6-dideoxygalactose transaminase
VAYRRCLKKVRGIRCLNAAGEKRANYAYFPILVEDDYPISRDELYQRLIEYGIHPRRYFYPLISEFPMYRGLPSAHEENLPVATLAALKVLCLPIYPDLNLSVVEELSSFIAAQ